MNRWDFLKLFAGWVAGTIASFTLLPELLRKWCPEKPTGIMLHFDEADHGVIDELVLPRDMGTICLETVPYGHPAIIRRDVSGAVISEEHFFEEVHEVALRTAKWRFKKIRHTETLPEVLYLKMLPKVVRIESRRVLFKEVPHESTFWWRTLGADRVTLERRFDDGRLHVMQLGLQQRGSIKWPWDEAEGEPMHSLVAYNHFGSTLHHLGQSEPLPSIGRITFVPRPDDI